MNNRTEPHARARTGTCIRRGPFESVRPADPPAAPGRPSRDPRLDGRRHRGVRRHLGLHQALRATGAQGQEGAEQITEVIGKSFESILQVAYDSGGSLLKFGGDALLLWFEGAWPRRARAATRRS